MRAHQIMTRDVVTVSPHATMEEAAKIMLRMHISGLPVMDDAGALVGMVSESDFLRRSEIGTGRKHAAWLKFFMGPGRAAEEFVHERGRKVEDVMTQRVICVDEDATLDKLVHLMERNDVKRLPVDLKSVTRQLRQSAASEHQNGLHIRYTVDVYGQAHGEGFEIPADMVQK